MPPPPLGKRLGRGTGKDGRPTVTDLIKARESEASLRETTDALRKELADERAQYAKYTFDESVRSARILAEKKFEYMEHINSIHGCSTSSSEATHPKLAYERQGAVHVRPTLVSHVGDSTPERRRELRRHVRTMIYGASVL